MASGEQPSPSKGKRQGTTVNSSHRNGLGEAQWMLLPNNLELSSRSRPTKKQRNKDKVRSLPPENFSLAANSVQASSNAAPEQNFPRTKFNTATWLKDQLVTEEKSKRHGFESDEVQSDAEPPVVPRGNLNPHPNQRLQVTRPQYSQGASSRRTVMENENTKSVKDECKKNEADSAIIFERISHLKDFLTEASSVWQNFGLAEEPGMKEEIAKLTNAVKKITDEEHEHKAMLQQMMVHETSGHAANGISPSSTNSRSSFTKGNVSYPRDVNGTMDFYSEEEQTNKCNHLIEKMKKSEERLMALQQQESLLFQMQKKAENKLAAFRAMLDKNDAGSIGNSQEIQNLPVERMLHGVQVNEAAVNSNDHWDETFQENQRQWTSENSLNTNNTDQGDFQTSNWKEDPQDLRKLHISLEHIKKRVQSIQQLSDNKNVTDPLSSDEGEIADVGERAAMVEWERKKLKNKLVELQEKKKKNDELLMELSFLKDAANMVNTLKNSKDGGESNFLPSTSRDTRQQLSKDKKNSKKIEELQATLEHLKGMMNAMNPEINIQEMISNQDIPNSHSQSIVATSSQENALSTRQTHSTPVTKRDNVSKEQNAGFPARRHYEAEGRANEDPDVPSAPAPVISPVPEDNSWQDNPRIQEKIRKLQVARDRLKMIQGLMGTIQEAKQNGKQIPLDHLQLLSSLEEEDQNDDMYDDDNVSDNDDKEDESSSPLNTNDQAVAPNDICEEISQKSLFENISRKSQEEAVNLEEPSLEDIMRERYKLAKLHDHVVRLRELLPRSENRGDDRVRSSGEGGNSQRQKPQQQAQHTIEGHLSSKHRQDNLQLTRQNIATMESQNRNSNPATSARDCSVIKKDNINNLSGKMGKLSIQNAVNGSVSETSRDNLDTMSSFSTEMNQSFTLRDDGQRKTVLDILNQDQIKQKSYMRNQDIHLGSNSSEDSEPLEGSNSALAPDTTVAATWGGSSTQDNFEDENEEQMESLEEQEEEDGPNMTVTAGAEHIPQVQFADQYSNFQHYIDTASVANDKKKENGRADNFQQMQPNQWTSSRKNFPNPGRTRPHPINTRIPPENPPEASGGLPQDAVPAQNGAIDAAADYHLRMSSKFILQLREQIDQLNALCQQRFFQEKDRPPVSVNQYQNPNCSAHPMANSYRPMSAPPEIMHHYNQQLLLSLSQCYHILFMQQLEIQHLHRCMQQNMGAESVHHSNSNSTQASTTEDFTLRPWFLSPWLNSTIPSMPFPTSQDSPMAAFLQSPPASAFPFAQPVMLPNSNPASVPLPQPVRAVVHPAAQEIRSNSETLNNQVPPRTRANNFLDNFRSYSRQNLLSTSSNIKRNENIGLPVAPQIRQVHPLVTNENAPSHRPREPLHSDGSNIVVAVPHLSERPVPNPELQELMNRSKRPNSSRHQTSFANRGASDLSRGSLLANAISSEDQPSRSNRYHAQNIEPTLLPSSSVPSNVNFSQPCQIQLDSKTGSFSNVYAPPVAEQQPPSAPIYSEISNILSQNENQPDFLLELFQELQNLKSDALRQRAFNVVRDLALIERRSNDEILQRALNAVRDLVSIERRSDDDAPVSTRNINGHAATIVKTEVVDNLEPQSDNHTELGSFTCITSGSEFPAARGTTESSSQWNSQNLPTAAIPPLGKHATAKVVSTGAVKKKPMSRPVCTYATTPLWDASAAHETNTSTPMTSTSRSAPDPSDNVVEKVVVELIPYIRGEAMVDDSSPIFRANVCSRIIDVLKANISTPLPNRGITQLRQSLEQLLIKYSGLKWYDCEADFLKNIAEFLFKELSHLNRTGQFTPLEETREVSGAAALSTSEMCPQPDLLPSVCKTVKEKRRTVLLKSKEEVDVSDANNYFLQQESEEQTSELSIKMPVEEIPVFPVQFNNVLPQEHVRGAIGGESNYILHSHIQPVHIRTVTAEEDMGCECDPEAETEPEVETGTEADLAEADQSPGQQNATTNSAPVDSWSIEQQQAAVPSRSGIAATAAVMLTNGDDIGPTESSLDSALGAQSYADACGEQEITLDDIPTKLSPLSEEELQRQMQEEQLSNSILMEVVDEIGLSGENDLVREPLNLK